jgi:hypothetical protein
MISWENYGQTFSKNHLIVKTRKESNRHIY